MAKAHLNPVIQGISGKVGNLVYRRMASGKTFVSRLPAKSNVPPSAAQNAHRQRFKQAAAQAKAALADPQTRAYYEAAAAGSHKTPYNLALSDCMSGQHPSSSFSDQSEQD